MSEESSTDVLGFIPADASYEITGKKIEERYRIFKAEIYKTRTENLAGHILEIKMVRDGKSWKIDREDDFSSS
jgi:hypothetical protein